MALPDFVLVEIKASAMEIDGCLKVLDIPEAARGLLDPLDGGIDRFEAHVSDAMLQTR